MIRKAFKVFKAVARSCRFTCSTWSVRLLFRMNGIRFGKRLRAIGIPAVNVSLGGHAEVGKQFTIRTGLHDTEIGAVGSRLRVGPKGSLRIGDRVGMSNATIVCEDSVEIGDDVFIGGGVQIFDTNFHSTDASIRASGHEARADVRTAPVRIGSRAFIGANALVCKGVTIGDAAIVAAGAVVSHSIPAGEVWAGNPAIKVR